MRSPELGQRSLFDARPPVTTVQARTSYQLGWPPNNADGPQEREPDYVEFDPNSASSTVSGWLHVQNGGSSGQGQVRLVSDVNANQWFVITAERIPGKSHRWYVNGKL
jgi:hypothetical protein